MAGRLRNALWFVVGAAVATVAVVVGRKVVAANQDTPALARVNEFIDDVRRASAEREAEIREALNMPEEGDE
ncbi:hypothetical protein [Raineyella sp. LH-20]|uniref:hypothetical protein n=1 Tax=Raineyella sp. LH-20 TaxID=3081204 RepID=UPI00295402DF|nr:hypothetical protein [Raineyella sp. LH-20]WOP17997.1 hypothetical protein R0146_12245 [Raineyella sp. LH-20]